MIRRTLWTAAFLAALAMGCQKEAPSKDKDKGETQTAEAGKAGQAGQPIPGAKKQLPAPPDVAKPPADAQKTAKGVSYKVLSKGKGGAKPTATDTVEVHYTGWTTDGKMFDSSVTRGKPTKFPLNRVIPGWTDGLQVMSEGDKVRFWIPEEMAYKGRPGAPQGMLVFDVELLKVFGAPKAPENVAAPPADATKTKTGLAYKKLGSKAGDGAKSPRSFDQVSVHYSGWTTDGKMFDSSRTRGRPATFSLNGVIAGWTEGLQLMKTGDSFRFWIPEKLAYKGQKGKPQGMLVFDVELLSVTERAEPPKTPKDVAKPPGGAKKTAKGVFYKVLKKGKGGPKPAATDTVEVHYTGWTTDGKMFDSSVTRGKPAKFPLNRVIAGWTDGLQVMSVGDKVRFWIPEEMAYKGRQGAPQGMLVFDVELLGIKGK
jgi:FKBP-type peptidyl-prolyl cis-trans isomerase